MSFDYGIFIVAAVGIVGAFVSWMMCVGEFRRRDIDRDGVFAAGALWLFGYAVVTVIVLLTSLFSKPVTPANEPLAYSYVSEQMGLSSGNSYPLVLGSRTGGSSGETDVSTTLTSGLFSARATTTMQSSSTPASAVSLGYTYEGKTYILEMPTSRITFIQSEDGEPSVTIWLSGESTFDFGQKVYEPYAATGCQWTFNNILVMCLWPDYNGPAPTPTIDAHASDVGLAPVIQGGFDRATITLTPEMYRQLLGIIE